MTETAHDSDLAFAKRLVDVATPVALQYFQRHPRRWKKSDGSLVTEADIAVEDAMRQLIANERPDDGVLGEEGGETGPRARRWILDAIDGTIAFAAGEPDWGTLVALEIDGELACGVCHEPVHERRYWAARGEGAFCEGPTGPPRALRVSGTDRLGASRSYVPPPRFQPKGRARRLALALAAASRLEPHTDHPALQVAFGGYEFAVFFTGGPWDLAAPALIVEEAGGRFTNLDGEHDITSGTAVFSNGLVHEDVLTLISRNR